MKSLALILLFATSSAMAADLPAKYIGNWASSCIADAQSGQHGIASLNLTATNLELGATVYSDAACSQNGTAAGTMAGPYTVVATTDGSTQIAAVYTQSQSGHTMEITQTLKLELDSTEKQLSVTQMSVSVKVDGQVAQTSSENTKIVFTKK